jgi:DNA-binding beta-propeller fold protein YncE
LQGTGTTIVDVSPNGTVTTFFQGGTGLGLTTALAVLKGGFVIVGNVPTTDGTFGTIQQGSILVLDKSGNVVANFANRALLNGPWDLTVHDHGDRATVFVSNVLSGTVSRFEVLVRPFSAHPIQLTSAVQIASGYPHRGDPAALVVGPGGLAYDPVHDLLYVASQVDNSIYVISKASRTTDHGRGALLVHDTTHLHGPMGLILAPNGNLIVANSDAVNADPEQPSELVEYTARGQFVAQFSVDPQNGAAFGLAISPFLNYPVLASVDDVTGSLKIYPIFPTIPVTPI